MRALTAFLVMVLAVTALPGSAVADGETPCKTDADCPGGWCVMAPCAAPACLPDTECEPIECDPDGYCVEFEPPTWMAGECATDADCPSEFHCKEVEEPCANVATCGCAPCPDDGECPPCDCPEPEPCEPTKVHMCVYEFVECTKDDECGEGYACHLVEECSGGGAMGCACKTCAEGEECPPCDCPEPEPPAEPECKVLGGVCAPKEVPCKTAADCLEGWECVEVSATSGGGSGGSTGTGCACACPEGETCPPCECDDEGGGAGTDPVPDAPPPPPDGGDGKADEGEAPVDDDAVSYCLPPGWGDAVEKGTFEGGSAGGSASGSAAEEMGIPGAPKGGSQNSGTDAPAADPTPGSDGSDGTSPPAGESAGGTGGSSSGGSSSGCTSTPEGNTPAGPVGLALLLLGLAVLRRR